MIDKKEQAHEALAIAQAMIEAGYINYDLEA
jgi:hypothetical protein